MSTTYESKVLIGATLEELFKLNGEQYEDQWDYRDAELGGMEQSTCDFMGYPLLDDGEEVETWNMQYFDFGKKATKLQHQFEMLTGIKPVMKCVLTSY